MGDDSAAAEETGFVPGTAEGAIVRNDGVRIELLGGAWVVDPRATWRLALVDQEADCDYDTWSERLMPPWTRVVCAAEGGRAMINHADVEGWTEAEGYNFATCTISWEAVDGRVRGTVTFTDEDDGSDRGSAEFDLPDCG